MRLETGNEIWTTQVKLPDNVDDTIIRYKFIVDGEWTVDQDMPVMANELGSRDNYIKIQVNPWNAIFIPLDFNKYL